MRKTSYGLGINYSDEGYCSSINLLLLSFLSGRKAPQEMWKRSCLNLREMDPHGTRGGP